MTKEGLPLNYIKEVLEGYIKFHNILSDKSILKKYNIKRKISRAPNFPSIISEHIAKFGLKKKGVDSNWDIQSGDLSTDTGLIEVKCFSSTGPSSFGPKEKWNKLVFVDATDFKLYNFKVYCIDIPNDSPQWKGLVLSGKENKKPLPDIKNYNMKDLKELCKERHIPCKKMDKDKFINYIEDYKDVITTFGSQCNQGRRPRISFKELQKRDNIKDNIQLIFKGNINDL